MNEQEIRIGVVGAGDVAHRHTLGLAAAGGVRVTAVAEIDDERRQRFARRHDVALAVHDYRLVLSSPDVDIVLVLTPHDLHAPVVLDALRAGKDVICEKPFGRSTRECDAMIDAAAGGGRKLLVAHPLREDFFYRNAARLVADGVLGRPLGVSVRWFTDELVRLDDPDHWKGTSERSGGGVLIDGGCHVADLANGLLGRPRRVSAFAGKLVASKEEVAEDTASFTVEYANGAVGSFFLSFTAGSAYRGDATFAAGMMVDLFGTEGHVEGGYLLRGEDFRRWCRAHRRGEPDRSFVHDVRVTQGEIDVALVRAYRGEGPPPVTPLEARNAVAVIEAAYEALASGATVDVDWRSE